MKYTNIPTTEIKVSKICLGTMTFGEQNSEKEAHEQLDYALAKGVNFIDTAELYAIPINAETQGLTEKYIGSWLKKHGKRNEVILASKAAGPMPKLTHIRNIPNFSEKHIKEAVNSSLQRLQTDYIDLYQLHWPERITNYFGQLGYQHKSKDAVTDFMETLNALKDLIKEGKIRHIGISNETPWGMMQYLNYAEKYDLPRIVTIQNPYSLVNRTFEVGLAEMAIREKVGLLAYSPLGGGILSGKYLNGNKPVGSRFTLYPNYFARYKNDPTTQTVGLLNELAKDHNLDVSQMSLAYVNTREFLTSNIIGATKLEQLKLNIDSINLELSKEVLNEIENIHKIHPFPAP